MTTATPTLTTRARPYRLSRTRPRNPGGPGRYYIGDENDAADNDAYDDKLWVLAIQRAGEQADDANIVAGLHASRFTHALADSGSDEHGAPQS